MGERRKLQDCHDCGAKPGKVHKPGCDIERCSVCGSQLLQCGCEGHDPMFARWTGIWPGAAEAEILGMDLNTLYTTGTAHLFFVKPKDDVAEVIEVAPGSRSGVEMLKQDILFCGFELVLVCDGRCEKAWGINNRPQNQLDPDNEDDYEYLADNELGEAPKDPGTYEGGHAKPRTPEQRMNKWCARECERSSTFKRDEEIKVKDFSVRMANYPWRRNEQGRV